MTFLAAGGNNSGKSILLQALAVWDFAHSVIEVNKGEVAWLAGTTGQGVGVSAEEFSPIPLPNLKHLWSDLKVLNGAAGNGYTLRIRCDWQTPTVPPADRHLEFGFALSNDRLFLTTIEVAAWEGQLVNKQFRKKTGTPQKDLMVEGSGFLQWLSVYALALNKDLDVLFLDEPDAHLHPALQGYLIHKLGQLARENGKQVLLATHSTTDEGKRMAR